MRFPSALLAPALVVALSFPALAEIVDPPACKRDLSPISKTLNQTMAALNVLAKMSGEEKCEAYRRQLFPVVMARDVLATCNTAINRDEEVARFDKAIEDVNSGIADSCR